MPLAELGIQPHCGQGRLLGLQLISWWRSQSNGQITNRLASSARKGDPGEEPRSGAESASSRHIYNIHISGCLYT
eukprot:361912-Pleurochrysis_carterae.AAC.2